MDKMTKIFIVCFGLWYFCLGSLYSASSAREEIGLEFKGQNMSAELQGVSLRLVLERLENKKGIWFKGDESALEESISVRFEDLPLHEGLRRILSNINHALIFDRERGLVGLFILGKKDPGRGVPRDAGVITGKSPPSQPAEEAAVSKDPFGVFSDADHTGNLRTRPADRTIGKGFSPLEDRNTQIGDNPFTAMSSGPENPFGENSENAALPLDNPFAESFTSASEHPPNESVSP